MTITAKPREQAGTAIRFFAAPPAIRAAFRLLERTAPSVGARWAERIWFTLPRTTNSNDNGKAPRPDDRPTVRGTAFRLDIGGHLVAGETWGAGPTVYLMHGWAGHRAQLAAFVPPLVERGFRVVAIDAPSHGDSGPGRHGSRSSSLPEFAETLAAVVAHHGPARAIIAHSMGATATAVALSDGIRAGRLAMLAPMASPESYAGYFARALGFGDRTLRRLVDRIERRIGAPLHHFDAVKLGGAIAMPPTLIVHDREDSSVPFADGLAVASAWPGSRFEPTSGLGHQRLLRDPSVVAEVVDFVSD